MPASPTTQDRRKGHERIMTTARHSKRIAANGRDRMESKPSDYVVTDPAAHAVRRAIEDRAMERELEAAMKPGWEK